MKRNSILIYISVVLVTVMVFIWGCENQATDPQVAEGTQQDFSANGLKKTAGTGSDHGYFWSLYQEGGSASITFPSAGTYAGNFAISYSNVNDVVGGKGWSTGSSRNIGYNIGSVSGSYNFVGVYGWTTGPLIEYYVAELGSATGGTYVNSVSSDGHSYSFYKQQRVNAPSIQGTQTFWQYKDTWGGSSTGSNHTVSMGNHINNWRNNGGQGFGNYNYQILALEAWGGRSGYINATVWEAGSGGSGGGGGGSGGGGGGSSYTISVAMRGTSGSEHVNLLVGGNTVASWTLSTSMNVYAASTTNSGGIGIQFDNDASGRDVQVDCIWLPNGQFQAENQSYNTGVWQNGSCGGSNSEWLHCNGMIGFSAYR